MTDTVSRTTPSIVGVGDTPVTVLRAGEGPPLLILHDELGYPGWMQWNEIGRAHV